MARALDRMTRYFYKARPLWVAVVALSVTVAEAEVINGAQLPDGARKVGENRYRAPGDYEETLKYYRTVYPAGTFSRKAIVNQPGVKAVHIVNPSGKNFEGLNIYEANEEVRIYIVPALAAAKPAKKAPEVKPGKKTR
ncbi:hypothetical protein POL68_41840 [Stigmatella sp. ncwal1]|uniref:Uncharacterized protein n=1 Tax=Stigmatella ashevillensis TaxID=2995309 RepID=A0ABT5DN28_9BACT|nr:hypothetical protein [Stigmatella ashevillena]MDC0715064.1 hypothetical protein [Stigmatella ashevillena]